LWSVSGARHLNTFTCPSIRAAPERSIAVPRNLMLSMEKTRRSQRPVSHRDTTEAPREMRRPPHAAARIVCGLVVALVTLGPAPVRAAATGRCIEGDWTTEASAFVMEETGIPIPKICVRWVRKERLDGLVFPVSRAGNHTGAWLPSTFRQRPRSCLQTISIPTRRSHAAISSMSWCMRSSLQSMRKRTSHVRGG
jgi:hypothetical protein